MLRRVALNYNEYFIRFYCNIFRLVHKKLADKVHNSTAVPYQPGDVFL
jgi:hypothetical protein